MGENGGFGFGVLTECQERTRQAADPKLSRYPLVNYCSRRSRVQNELQLSGRPYLAFNNNQKSIRYFERYFGTSGRVSGINLLRSGRSSLQEYANSQKAEQYDFHGVPPQPQRRCLI